MSEGVEEPRCKPGERVEAVVLVECRPRLFSQRRRRSCVGARNSRTVYSYSTLNSGREDVDRVPISTSRQKIQGLK